MRQLAAEKNRSRALSARDLPALALAKLRNVVISIRILSGGETVRIGFDWKAFGSYSRTFFPSPLPSAIRPLELRDDHGLIGASLAAN